MEMYRQISKNKSKTFLFLLFFIVLIVAVTYAFGYSYSTPEAAFSFAVIAFIAAFAGSFITYYYSDRILLKMADAHPVSKEEDPYLYHTIEGVALAAGLPVPKAYVIETDIPNAFATGRNPQNAAVAVTRGLLNIMNREELEGVIAHEISHIKNYDILYASIAVVLAGSLVYVSGIMRRTLFYSGGKRRSRNNKSNPLILAVGLIAIIIAPLIARLIQLAMSRSREYLADATAARVLGYPLGLASALEKLALHNNPAAAQKEGFANEATAGLFIINPLTKNMNAGSLLNTHPPLENRIDLLRKM